MRKALWMASATLLVLSPLTLCSQDQPQPQQQPPPEKQAQQPSKQQQQQDALAAAARKARAEKEKKNAPKPAVVWTNDNIPKTPGQLSLIGPPPAAPKEGTAEGAQAGAKTEGQPKEKKEPVKNEAYWRAKFTDARQGLQKAELELSVIQRELARLQVEYYPDPQKALAQQYSRSDINKKQADIDAKQTEIAQRKQAISDMQDELRRSGGDPGWANE
jgi:hypothetical protein